MMLAVPAEVVCKENAFNAAKRQRETTVAQFIDFHRQVQPVVQWSDQVIRVSRLS